MNFDRGDTLLLTTHSPYIMTSINNLIQANNLSKENPEEAHRINKLIPFGSWINYEDISAWAVDNGTVRSINDDEYNIISTDELDKASEVISDDFAKLL